MVSSSPSLLATMLIMACYLVTGTKQHYHKWYNKPFLRDGPPKLFLHKSQLPPVPLYMPAVNDKPLKTDRCELRKVVFTQDAESPQYIVYKSKIPDLKEFTLCHWHNIFNYTHDQPIFSYSNHGKPRTIYSWIENSPQKSYYSLAINGHTIYRINYPEKLFKWYHVCQSWNGHTGEWQLWINAERVGRGFYNLMAGKVIKGGGVAISGREHLEQALAVHFPGFSGELTLVTLYKAALTAGKAYNNHKHHHVHNFHHGYDPAVDEADANDAPGFSTTAGPDPTPPPHLAHGGKFANGQLLPKLPVVPAVKTAAAESDDRPAKDDEYKLFDGGLYDFYAPLHQGIVSVPGPDDPFRVNLLDRRDDGRHKRYGENDEGAGWTPMSARAVTPNVRVKRMTVDSGNARSGGSRERKVEPAQWEVLKVGAVCSACEPDPFGAASVLSWHDTRKQFFNGALYLSALPKCYSF